METEKRLSSNSRWTILSISAILVTAPIATSSSAKAANFSFTQIDVPGATATYANGINTSGQIVGYFNDSTGVVHGFLDTGGNFTTIDIPSAISTFAYGINDAGQIVGYFNDSTGYHGFVDTGGNFTTIYPPRGATYTSPSGITFAYGINDAGQIVGDFYNVGGHGFLDTGGSFTQIDVPSATYTQAFGINNAGQIVGDFSNGSFPATSTHGFLDMSGSFTRIDVPGATDTSASGINNTGQIVGYFYSGGGHGFLDTGGSFTQIDVPGAAATFASGINDAGQIVGYFYDSTSIHGLLATATGDPHFTTYDGVHYDYQGIGDFLLTGSSVDQFEVQVRTKPTYDGSAVTIMSEAAATLCNQTVTFDIDRASAGSFVWLDGSSLSLSIGSPVLIGGGCEIDQVSANDYRLIWNTGEVLDVINQGTYLDLSSQLSWLNLLGSMEGLLSSDVDPDRWRVTGAASLFSPVPEPPTLALLGIAIAMLCAMRRRVISPVPL